MTAPLATLLLLSALALIQTTKVPQLTSLTMVQLGESNIFNCPCLKNNQYFYLYKQPLGRLLQTIAVGVYDEIKMSEQFNTRFNVTKVDVQYVFTIRGITKEDEALYLCQSGNKYGLEFTNSTFLAVKDQTNQQKFISVEQNPPSASVQRGHSVNLQCSLQFEEKQNPVQCPGEHNVYWFRTGEHRPGVIYTHKNKTEEQDKRKCVYHLSKTFEDSSDSGTYYCAVAACGQILFGGGTEVETDITEPEKDPVVIAFGVLSAFCVTVITILCVLLSKNAVSHLDDNRRTRSQSEDLDGGAQDVSYSALTFSATTKQGNKKKREQDCVYSTVIYYHTQPN